jgi:glycosyltransferase involved in cell wall biosynthesis
MNFQTIMVVYDSFSAVRDIIEQGKDGIIVPKGNGTFSIEEMAKGIESAINNEEKTHEMALTAIGKSKQYALDHIVNQWMRWFERVVM